MSQLNTLQEKLQPGKVYRRQELTKWSKSVDRHLQQLQKNGILKKLSPGLYYCPKKNVFGEVPADETTLVETFLKDHRFLLTSANAYNVLGVGTTQLYNETVVYNHKRHGKFVLGGRLFSFQVKPAFPKKLNKEFLLVDLVNNLEQLAEDHENLLKSIKKKALTFDKGKLVKAVRNYGNVRAKKFFAETLEDEVIHYVA
jgi:hypothetical protein